MSASVLRMRPLVFASIFTALSNSCDSPSVNCARNRLRPVVSESPPWFTIGTGGDSTPRGS